MKLARMASISRVLLEEGLGFLTSGDRPAPVGVGDGAPAVDAPPPHQVAERLRRTLERLGPTFVKFGQLLATRVDLFDEAVLAELGKLHSAVPPFDGAEARRMVAAELERPIDEVFAAFSDEPVAAASIAQVHRARLRDGSDVAVKVQRPNLEQSLLADLDTLVVLSGFLDRLVPPYRRSMVHRLAEEYALRARTELDFRAEARAIDRFADVLATVPGFRVPTLHPTLCTSRLLVMEWLDGTKLDAVASADQLERAGFDPEGFCRSMFRLQLSMCYEHGFVHGDTHPGNLILLRGGYAGQIGLVDFGLHGEIPRALRDKMLEMLFCQASGKVAAAVDAFVAVFQPDPSIDLGPVKRDLAEVLSEGGEAGALRDRRVTEQLVRAMRVGAKYRLRTHSELFVVVRNLTIVEGIVLRYCPTFDAAAEVAAITGGILRRKLLGPSMRAELTDLLPQLMLTLSQRPRLAERLLRLERAFTQADDLGAFLRQQNVIRDAPAGRSWAWMAASGAIGVALGLAIGWWVFGR